MIIQNNQSSQQKVPLFILILVCAVSCAFVGYLAFEFFQPKKEANLIPRDGKFYAEELTNKKLNSTPDASLPVPAKKLQKLIQAPDKLNTEIDNTQLEARMQALDKQLSELNQQLKDQGISQPEATSKAPVGPVKDNLRDTQERLEYINNHMLNKDVEQQTN